METGTFGFRRDVLLRLPESGGMTPPVTRSYVPKSLCFYPRKLNLNVTKSHLSRKESCLWVKVAKEKDELHRQLLERKKKEGPKFVS